MPIFSERLESTFATLARPFTPGDGEPEANIAGAEDRLGLKLPSVLRTYYLLAGRFYQFNRAHNRLLRRLLADPHLILMRLIVIVGLHPLASHGPRSMARP
jgi:hypothetical protein